MYKSFSFGVEAREKIVDGVNLLNNAVSSTLGAKGRYVVIEQPNGDPHVTKDGVSVARAVVLEDKFEQMGAEIVKRCAQKTEQEAGDGTTTATLIAATMLNGAIKEIEEGKNPVDIRESIDKDVKLIISELNKYVRKVKSEEDLYKVALISTNGDTAMSDVIAKAVYATGLDGIVEVKAQPNTNKITLEKTDGYFYNKGVASPYFLNGGACVFEQANLITLEKLEESYLIPKIEEPTVIMATKYSDQVLSKLSQMALDGVPVCAVYSPAFGQQQKDIMDDITAITEGTVSNFKATVSSVQFSGEQAPDERIEQIKSLMNDDTSDYDKKRMEERIAALSGSLAIIRIGGMNDIDLKERVDRVDDALGAVRNAYKEGYVPGAGVALRDVANDISISCTVYDAIVAPHDRILKNAGIEDTGNIFIGLGYDVRSGELSKVVDDGIIDPLTVTRCALENAANVVKLMISTECIITRKETAQDDV